MMTFHQSPKKSRYLEFRPTSTTSAYLEALKALDGKPSRKVGNNTYMQADFDGVGIYLHRSCVILYLPTGHIILNSHGWRTLTTKSRLCSFLPEGYSVFQSKKQWYVQLRNGKTVEFHDWMQV